MTASSQVKQKCVTFTDIQTEFRRLPRGISITPNTITILDLKQTDGGATVVTVGVEVFVFPPVLGASVEESRHQLFVA